MLNVRFLFFLQFGFFNMKIIKYLKSNRLMNLFYVMFFSIFSFGNLNCQNTILDAKILSMKAPDKFLVKFVTTKGDFEITAERKFSPLAVDRFYQLIKSNYFDNVLFYRCVSNFVAQFGTLDTILDNTWSKNIILDESVIMGNELGNIAFARAGKNSRGTQLFINLNNNARLDTIFYGETLGFPAFGKVTSGMDVVLKLYTGYGDEPRQKIDSISGDIIHFFKENYPALDFIKKASIIK